MTGKLKYSGIGIGCVVAACAVTLAVLTWVIEPDDGLESLMALPIAAVLGGAACFVVSLPVRPRRAARAVSLIGFSGLVAWGVMGAALGIGDDVVGRWDSATALLFTGGVMFIFGCGCGLALGVSSRAVAHAIRSAMEP